MIDEHWWSTRRRQLARLVALGCALLGARGQSQTAGAAVEVKLHDVPITVTASSELADPKNPGRYGPANLLDEDPTTIWAEGAKGSGAREWVELRFPPGTAVSGFLVVPGNPKDSKLYLANARPRKVKLEVMFAEGRMLGHELAFPKSFPAGGAIYVEQISGWPVEAARLTIVSVWPGSKYRDLCVATFVPVFRGPDQHSLKTFLGTGKELAPTLAAFLYNPGSVFKLLPSPDSGVSSWLRVYARVPHAGALPRPQYELDMSNSSLDEWMHYRHPLSQDVAGAGGQSDLFRLTPVKKGTAGYVLDPIGPPSRPDRYSNFRVHLGLVEGEWKVVGLDLKFQEETP
jgi:hypothetical protein